MSGHGAQQISSPQTGTSGLGSGNLFGLVLNYSFRRQSRLAFHSRFILERALKSWMRDRADAFWSRLAYYENTTGHKKRLLVSHEVQTDLIAWSRHIKLTCNFVSLQVQRRFIWFYAAFPYLFTPRGFGKLKLISTLNQPEATQPKGLVNSSMTSLTAINIPKNSIDLPKIQVLTNVTKACLTHSASGEDGDRSQWPWSNRTDRTGSARLGCNDSKCLQLHGTLHMKKSCLFWDQRGRENHSTRPLWFLNQPVHLYLGKIRLFCKRPELKCTKESH